MGCLGYGISVEYVGSVMQLKELFVSEAAKEEHLLKDHFLVWRNERDVATCRWTNGDVDWTKEVQGLVCANKRQLENHELLPRGRGYALVA